MTTSSTVNIGGRNVGNGAPTFVIAEVGINHNGEMKLAEQLLRAASAAGADAVKLQTYLTEKRVPADSPIFEILKRCELSFDQQRELFQLGTDLGLLTFSTPFDDESVAFLEEADVPAFKVASFDVVNLSLLEQVAATRKPVVLSRGMADAAELDRAVRMLDETGSPRVLLHCVSAYPVPAAGDLHLSTIGSLKERYGCPVGFSDHWAGPEAAVCAVAAGAEALEKHFTLDRDMDGPDHAISADPAMLQHIIERIRWTEEALGSPATGALEAEAGTVQYRRPSPRRGDSTDT